MFELLKQTVKLPWPAALNWRESGGANLDRICSKRIRRAARAPQIRSKFNIFIFLSQLAKNTPFTIGEESALQIALFCQFLSLNLSEQGKARTRESGPEERDEQANAEKSETNGGLKNSRFMVYIIQLSAAFNSFLDKN